MRVVAFLPAKGSSDRIDNKNLKLLDGKPLFLHTLEKLMECSFLDEVFLDTESEEIIAAASHVGCKILRRSPDLANNRTDGNRLFINEVNHIDADIYIQILGTSPFIQPESIQRGIAAVSSPSNDYDSAVMVRSERQYLWRDGKPAYDINRIPNSVDLEASLIETMGLYIVSKDAALKTNRRIGERPFLIQASALEAIDVNWPEDFELANLIAGGMREQSRKLYASVKRHLTSSLLSDLLDDCNYKNQIVKGLSPNIEGVKILGRAKTLKLRAMREGDGVRGIYEALQSYHTVVPGDIIVVENELPEYAYFGELNASLAIRSGASGVIVGGKTRDANEVRRLGLPVFAAGATCQDVRGRATTESINKPIMLGTVRVCPGEMIFGDSEGVVIIPRAVEDAIFKEVFQRAAREEKILVELSQGEPVDALVRKYGYF